jgi:hypothetical protein
MIKWIQYLNVEDHAVFVPSETCAPSPPLRGRLQLPTSTYGVAPSQVGYGFHSHGTAWC